MRFVFEGLLQATLSISCLAILMIFIEKALYRYFKPTAAVRIWALLFVRAAVLVPVTVKIVDIGGKITDIVGNQNVSVTDQGEAVKVGIIHINTSPAIFHIIFWLWVAGGVLFSLAHIGKYMRLQRKLYKTSIQDSNLFIWCEKVSLPVEEKMKKIAIRICPNIKSPMLIGYFRKTVYMPAEKLEKDDLILLLSHEVTHYKRKDLWLKLFYLSINALHWFNPMVYLATKKAGEAIEFACDYEVVKDKDAAVSRKYAELLIYILQSNVRRTTFSAAFSTTGRYMEQRFRNIMSRKKKKRGIIVFIIAFFIILAIQPFMYCEIHAEPYQDSYLIIQQIEDGVGTQRYIELRDLYYSYVTPDGKQNVVKRVGDQSKISLPAGEEILFYLSENRDPIQLNKFGATEFRFHINEKTRLQIGYLNAVSQETTDTVPSVILSTLKEVATPICVKNDSSTDIFIY